MGSRWIMVSDGTSQMMYAGKTDLTEDEIDSEIENGKLVELSECRAMRTILVPAPEGGISQSEMLSPVSIARAAVRLKIKVLGYFWPDEDPATLAAFESKIKPVEQAELNHRAAEAGLVTADGMRARGTKLIS